MVTIQNIHGYTEKMNQYLAIQKPVLQFLKKKKLKTYVKKQKNPDQKAQ
jgi:hypothetical protein